MVDAVGTRTTLTSFFKSFYTSGSLRDTITTFFMGESRGIQVMMFVTMRYHFPPGTSKGMKPGVDVMGIFINF